MSVGYFRYILTVLSKALGCIPFLEYLFIKITILFITAQKFIAFCMVTFSLIL